MGICVNRSIAANGLNVSHRCSASIWTATQMTARALSADGVRIQFPAQNHGKRVESLSTIACFP